MYITTSIDFVCVTSGSDIFNQCLSLGWRDETYLRSVGCLMILVKAEVEQTELLENKTYCVLRCKKGIKSKFMEPSLWGFSGSINYFLSKGADDYFTS